MSYEITEVRLLSVPLENDYKHTLYFTNYREQENYFLSRSLFSELNFSYQRKDRVIRYPKHCDELSSCNYVMYRNPITFRWVYAFITEKTYINEERTDISIETDVMQTYLFDYTVQPSFIEREHTDDDTLGNHTIPENLEVGEYICEYKDIVSDLVGCSYVIGATSYPSDGVFKDGGGNRYDGIYSGIWYGAFTPENISKLNALIEDYAEAGKTDSIKCLFMYPSSLIETYNGNSVIGRSSPKEITKKFFKTSYSSYSPKNMKLYTYPYQYILVSNNNGGSAIYQFEHFPDNTIEFSIRGCLTPGGSIRLIPKNYKGIAKNDEEGLNLGKYPICNWNSDEYTNWLTQNSVNIGLNIASGIGQIVGGVAMSVATGGVGMAVGGSSVVSGVSAITNQLAQIHQMSFTPPQSHGNINCGDIITADGVNTFTISQMRIKDEFLKIIDDYFSMFGYKCNRVKKPLKNHRENYWFTKTIDVSIDGNIANNDLQKIKNCYNNGITFWTNPNNIGNYSVRNSII